MKQKTYILLLILLLFPFVAEAQTEINEGDYYDEGGWESIEIKGDSLFMYGREEKYPFISYLIARAKYEYVGKNRIQLICDEDDSLHINGERIKYKNSTKINDSVLKWRGKKYISQDVIIDVIPLMPCFPGGQSALVTYLSENMKYPEEARKNNIEGRVVVKFTVKKNGSVSHVHVVKSVDPLLDKECIRVVKNMPKWTPGKLNGKPVAADYAVPIDMRLE